MDFHASVGEATEENSVVKMPTTSTVADEFQVLP